MRVSCKQVKARLRNDKEVEVEVEERKGKKTTAPNRAKMVCAKWYLFER